MYFAVRGTESVEQTGFAGSEVLANVTYYQWTVRMNYLAHHGCVPVGAVHTSRKLVKKSD